MNQEERYPKNQRNGRIGLVSCPLVPLLQNPGHLISVIDREDEICLIHLLQALRYCKRLIQAGMPLSLASGSAVAFLLADRYRFYFTVVLEQTIMKESEGVKTAPIDSSGTALTRLKKGFIPSGVAEAAGSDERAGSYRLDAKLPRDSNLLVVEAKGTSEKEGVYLRLITAVMDAFVQSYVRMLHAIKARPSAQLERAELELDTIRDNQPFAVSVDALKRILSAATRRLESLKEEKNLIDDQSSHIRLEEKIARKHVCDYELSLKRVLEGRSQTLEKFGDACAVVIVLTLGNEIQQYQIRIAEVQRWLDIALPEKRRSLEKAVTDNLREQQKQIELINRYEAELEKQNIERNKQEKLQLLHIGNIRFQIAELKPTRVLQPTGSSAHLVSPGKLAKLTLGVFLGMIFVMVAVLVTEMRSKLSVSRA